MLATELIERVQNMVREYGDVPVFDWDDDEITEVSFFRAETLAYGDCPAEPRWYPDRLVLRQ